MNEIITARDSDIIAAEINTIKEDTRRVMIANAIRIGGKLTEAKSMVDHGQWGKWLEEKVDYSQSTANNLMKLYQEYGTGEVSLFDNWTNSETFAKLTYTQHMALLALPFADRMDFAESHNVEEMSTRELDKAVREEVDRLKAELEAVTAERDETEDSLRTLRDRIQNTEDEAAAHLRDLLQAKQQVREAEAEIADHAKTADKAMKDLARAEKSEKNALNLVEKLKKELSAAEAAKADAEKKLAQVQENPEIPESAMEEMRRQIEKDTAEKAAAELEKRLTDAQKQADAATAQARAAEEQLATAQKQIKMSDPDIVAYQTIAKQMMETYKTLNDLRLQVAEKNTDAGERLTRFQTQMLTQWIDVLQNA